MAFSVSNVAQISIPLAFSVSTRASSCGSNAGRLGGAIVRRPLRLAIRSRPEVTGGLRSLESVLSAFDRMMLEEWPGSNISHTMTPSRAPFEVHEELEAYEVKLAMPGLSKEDVSVKVEDGKLVIKGEQKKEEVKELQGATEGAEEISDTDDQENTKSESAPDSGSSDALKAQEAAPGQALSRGRARIFSGRRYHTVLSLPEDAEVEGIQASMEHGVLTVRVPRVAEEKPKAVEVPVN